MRQLRAWFIRVFNLFRGERPDHDISQELNSHLQMHIDDNLRAGMTPEEARRQALIKLGGVEQAKERYQERRGLPFLETFWQDLRFGARMLRKSPGFTVVAVLTLTLGIGFNTGVFQIFNALALRPLEMPGSKRLVAFYQNFRIIRGPLIRDVHGNENAFSYAEYKQYRDQNHVFSGLLAYDPFVQATLSTDPPRQFLGALTSCNYFSVLGTNAVLGRGFVDSDCAATGSGAVVVLSDDMWRSAFAADPSIVGKAISLNQVALTVVGVAPRGFMGTEVTPSAFWVPLTMQPQLHAKPELPNMLADDNLSWLELMGRVRDDFSDAQVQADLGLIAGRLDRTHPGVESKLTVVRPTLFSRPQERRIVLSVGAGILFAVGLVLLIACANLASLLLARATTRRREIAIRLSTGASRGRLVRQLLTESLLLALLGGLLGSILAFWSFEAVLKFVLSRLPAGFPGLNLNLTPDLRVLAYVLLLTMVTAIGFGLLPALQASRMDLNAQLKDETSDLHGSLLRGGILRRSLVEIQVTVSMVLLVVAGLLLHGLYRAQTLDPGFRFEDISAVSFDLPGQGYTPEHASAIEKELVRRLATTPGVEEVAQAECLPLGNSHEVSAASIPGQEATQRVELNYVSANFFETISIPIIRGRSFTPSEVQTDAKAVIVTEFAARRFWPNKDPIGQRLLLWRPPKTIYEVVGVAKDAQMSRLGETHSNYLYFPAGPSHQARLQLLVRASQHGAPWRAIQSVVRTVDPTLVADVRPLGDNFESWRAPARLAAGLSAVLGLLALLLAAGGIYGTVSFAVSGRIREIGIRMALGADGHSVMRLILHQAMRPVLIGAAVGLAACAAVSRILSVALFGLSSLDPVAFLTVPLFLIAVALLASFIPARRAMHVDPITALRYE
ncbi:MAG: ABC transporter permease [Acidobacteriia bacterium]|nr:ABC transporter permease [Terriglobia bacterium]